MVHPLSFSIERRTFLAAGLAIPFVIQPRSHQSGSLAFYPITMSRCLVVMQGHDRPVQMWCCQIGGESQCDLTPGWWLLISQFEGSQPHLRVIQPISALPQYPGLSGLLAARITFRLQVLQRRSAFRQELNKRRIVQHVNRQILKAMENLPG